MTRPINSPDGSWAWHPPHLATWSDELIKSHQIPLQAINDVSWQPSTSWHTRLLKFVATNHNKSFTLLINWLLEFLSDARHDSELLLGTSLSGLEPLGTDRGRQERRSSSSLSKIIQRQSNSDHLIIHGARQLTLTHLVLATGIVWPTTTTVCKWTLLNGSYRSTVLGILGLLRHGNQKTEWRSIKP